jgi:hypothetical protein
VRRRWIAGPTALAIIVTLANAIKPVVVDDTAYLAYARHIAEHPLDPYGFEIFWYTVPDPAMEVLAPPVVPYWLALGIRLFGEHPAMLKLWLFPFVWLFARSLYELLRRFARDSEPVALPLIVLSPAVLPMVNLMLDIPAASLGLASLMIFIRSCARSSFRLAILSGIVAALAMQTKYTALLVPVLLLWYGFSHRSLRLSIIAVAVSTALFAGWEASLWRKYDRSHFLFHLTQQEPGADFLSDKEALLPPLLGHLGCLAMGIGLYAGRAVSIPGRMLVVSAVLWSAGAALIALLPYHDTILISGRHPGQVKLALASIVWRTAGSAILLTALSCAMLLLVRRRRENRWRFHSNSVFVVGWVLLEIASYFALTPFPAARRVIGVTIALGILAARVVSRTARTRPDRRPPRWVLPFGIAVGVAVAAIDTYDALPEKVLANRAAENLPRPRGKSWFVGHWGFQFYCEKQGLTPVIPGRSVLKEGDGLVIPLYPDDVFLYRPHSGSIPIHPPADAVALIAVFEWDDWLSAQTIPNFYGGTEPVVGRDRPRLLVAVYRMTRTWSVPGR